MAKFSLLEDIKSNPLYKNKGSRDAKARSIIEDETDLAKKTDIHVGQLMMFKYLNPLTIEELEYYDASPCTIFFGIFNATGGKRVMGFNIHYFPPTIRYRIMDKIFKLYQPIYMKYFETGVTHDLDAFDYKYLVDALEKANLSWAVRMYIPARIGEVRVIPPKMWSTAIFTEGWFKKETRSRIMELFKQDSIKKGKQHTTSHLNRKRKQ